jgi:hypothetical protein
MPYGFVMDVEMPAEVYDAVHTEVMRRSDGADSGLLLHVARATDRGFSVVEVWESREQCERFEAEVMVPVITEIAGADRVAQGPPPREEFEPRGLVVPGRSPLLV